MKTFLFRCKRIVPNPGGLMAKLRARQGGPVRDGIVTMMILFYLLQIYGCIVDWRPVRSRLYLVSILFTLLWVSLKNLFALHALVRGTKQLCFFPRPYFRSIHWINRTLLCMLLSTSHYAWLYRSRLPSGAESLVMSVTQASSALLACSHVHASTRTMSPFVSRQAQNPSLNLSLIILLV